MYLQGRLTFLFSISKSLIQVNKCLQNDLELAENLLDVRIKKRWVIEILISFEDIRWCHYDKLLAMKELLMKNWKFSS